jgi:alanyl-tRNA synthetase
LTFLTFSKVTDEELSMQEDFVNARIRPPVNRTYIPFAQAVEEGAMALFWRNTEILFVRLNLVIVWNYVEESMNNTEIFGLQNCFRRSCCSRNRRIEAITGDAVKKFYATGNFVERDQNDIEESARCWEGGYRITRGQRCLESN